MASPFKTHETMDLARALLEEDSNSYTNCSGSTRINNNEEVDPPKPSDRYPLDPSDFDNLVVTKDSSTELIPTQLVEESGADSSSKGKKLSKSNNSKPALMMVRDLNAGKGMLDDDGKPVVGKVFSRVIQVSGGETKPKQLKAHHRGRSTSSCCRERHGGGGQGQEKDKSSSVRPKSGEQRQRISGQVGAAQKECPTCNKQFSDETVMENHIVFCTGSSKEIM